MRSFQPRTPGWEGSSGGICENLVCSTRYIVIILSRTSLGVSTAVTSNNFGVLSPVRFMFVSRELTLWAVSSSCLADNSSSAALSMPTDDAVRCAKRRAAHRDLSAAFNVGSKTCSTLLPLRKCTYAAFQVVCPQKRGWICERVKKVCKVACVRNVRNSRSSSTSMYVENEPHSLTVGGSR